MIRAVTLIPVLLLSASFALSGIGHAESTPLSCDGKPAHFHVHRVERVANKAFGRDRFLDATPTKRSERKAMRAHKFCVTGGYRERAKARIDKARARFDAFYESLLVPPGRSTLAAIASCESGGNYSTNTGNGFYGAFQFDLQTWGSVGGYGLPSSASPREQDYRAALLYQQRGSQPWPVCGR